MIDDDLERVREKLLRLKSQDAQQRFFVSFCLLPIAELRGLVVIGLGLAALAGLLAHHDRRYAAQIGRAVSRSAARAAERRRRSGMRPEWVSVYEPNIRPTPPAMRAAHSRLAEDRARDRPDA